MKKQLLILILTLLPLAASADAVEIDGIYYNLTTGSKVAEVTSNPNGYSGNVVIPESVIYNDVTYSVTSISGVAFGSCSGLTSVTIPNSVTTIGDYAFYWCSGLTSVTIPNSVTSIGYAIFYNCSGLISVTIPNSVTSVGNSAFSRCSGLTYVTIPNSVTSIGAEAFYRCSGLTSVTIPNSVTNIDDGAFAFCSGLASVIIPNSVTSIGNSAFSACSGLTSIEVESGNTKYDSRDNCNAIIETASNALVAGCKSTVIPNSVTSIGAEVFISCSGLTSITIPNSVTSIGGGAFYGCSGLTSVNIGNGIKSIYYQAFALCPNLTDVTCYAENVPSTDYGAFNESYIEFATLHVPSSSVNAYKTAEPWKNFKEIVSITENDPNPSGIKAMEINAGDNIIIYNMNGVRQPEPKKGLNIVRTSDGRAKKVVVK